MSFVIPPPPNPACPSWAAAEEGSIAGLGTLRVKLR